jgi:HD-like signal output (HDOD) protein
MKPQSELASGVFERLQELPALPALVQQLHRLVGGGPAAHAELMAIAGQDAALPARMLRLINGAAPKPPFAITSLDQALILLGPAGLECLALPLALIALLPGRSAPFNMSYFWFHSAVAAGVNREIARRFWRGEPETAYLVGLLQDLGTALLLALAPAAFGEVIATASRERTSFHAAALTILGLSECELAAEACSRWGLDSAVGDAIRHQHAPELASDPALAACCGLTSHLCARHKIKAAGSFDSAALDRGIIRQLRLEGASLRRLMAIIPQQIAQGKLIIAVAR